MVKKCETGITIQLTISPFRPRMKLYNGAPQVFPVKMRINLGGCNRFVSEHVLDCPQIGPAFDEMGCEGVPECMRTD